MKVDLLDIVKRIELRRPDQPPIIIDEAQILMARLVRDGKLKVGKN